MEHDDNREKEGDAARQRADNETHREETAGQKSFGNTLGHDRTLAIKRTDSARRTWRADAWGRMLIRSRPENLDQGDEIHG
jgi:hypothetical protein